MPAPLLPWLLHAGVRLDARLAISDAGAVVDGTGILAAADIEENATLATIPKTAVLSVHNWLSVHAVADVAGVEELRGDNAPLALACMVERARGKASPWYGYFESMERIPEPLPMFWDEEAVALLEGTELEGAPEQDNADIAREWTEEIEAVACAAAREVKADASRVSERAYKEALSLVMSRAFFVDEVHGNSLVPLADVFNHKCARVELADHVVAERDGYDDDDDDDDDDRANDSNDVDEDTKHDATNTTVRPTSRLTRKCATSGLDMAVVGHDEDTIAIIAQRAFERNEEILNCYGQLSNGTCLHDYGFVPSAHNPFHIVNVSRDLVYAACAEQRGERATRLAARRIPPDVDAYFELPASTAMVPEDLAATLHTLCEGTWHTPRRGVPVDELGRDEAAMLARVVELRLEQYPPLADDASDEQARDDAEERGVRALAMALALRSTERSLLKQWLEAAQFRASRARKRRR